MKELQVVVTQQAAVISANFEEIKQMLSAEMEQYKGLVYDDTSIKVARNDVATLRKVAKALDAKRKEVKKAHMIPYEEFEKQAKELIDIINGAIDPIELQIKEHEEMKRADRKIEIQKYFNDRAENNPYVCIEHVWDPKWLSNMSTSMKSIRAAIDSYIEGVNMDVESILAFGSEAEEKALTKYLTTRKLSDAITIIQEHERMKAEIIAKEEARRREEEERKQRELEARIRAEEEARFKAIEEEKRKIAEEAAAKAREEERKRIEKELAEKVVNTPIVESTKVNSALEPIELNELPPVQDDLPKQVELEPIELGSRNDELIQKIVDLLLERLSYAYCDNCGTEDCDECHRKYQNWKLGEGTAYSIAKEIVEML